MRRQQGTYSERIRAYTSRAMIRVSPAMVKQAQDRRTVNAASTPQKNRPARRELLPSRELPQIAHRSLRSVGQVDAVFAVIPVKAPKSVFDGFPERERWQKLNARSRPGAATVR